MYSGSYLAYVMPVSMTKITPENIVIDINKNKNKVKTTDSSIDFVSKFFSTFCLNYRYKKTKNTEMSLKILIIRKLKLRNS